MTEVRRIEARSGVAAHLHVGVAVAAWNSSITDRLLEGALGRLESDGVAQVTVAQVPGALELSVAASALIESGCHAVVALGAVIKGDTDHYDVVVRESARGLSSVALATGVPVTNGILAAADASLAVERARPGPSNKGAEAAAAALATAAILRRLHESSPHE